MPKRRPGDRERIEQTLAVAPLARPSLLDALLELCDVFDLPRNGWQQTPLAAVFETAAVVRRAQHLRATLEISERTAIDRACAELDVEPETLRTTLKRWRAYGRAGFKVNHNDSRDRCNIPREAGTDNVDPGAAA